MIIFVVLFIFLLEEGFCSFEQITTDKTLALVQRFSTQTACVSGNTNDFKTFDYIHAKSVYRLSKQGCKKIDENNYFCEKFETYYDDIEKKIGVVYFEKNSSATSTTFSGLGTWFEDGVCLEVLGSINFGWIKINLKTENDLESIFTAGRIIETTYTQENCNPIYYLFSFSELPQDSGTVGGECITLDDNLSIQYDCSNNAQLITKYEDSNCSIKISEEPRDSCFTDSSKFAREFSCSVFESIDFSYKKQTINADYNLIKYSEASSLENCRDIAKFDIFEPTIIGTNNCHHLKNKEYGNWETISNNINDGIRFTKSISQCDTWDLDSIEKEVYEFPNIPQNQQEGNCVYSIEKNSFFTIIPIKEDDTTGNGYLKIFEKGTDCEDGFIDFAYEIDKNTCFSYNGNGWKLDCTNSSNPQLTRFEGYTDCPAGKEIIESNFNSICNTYEENEGNQLFSYGCGISANFDVVESDYIWMLYALSKNDCDNKEKEIYSGNRLKLFSYGNRYISGKSMSGCTAEYHGKKGRYEGIVSIFVETPDELCLNINLDNVSDDRKYFSFDQIPFGECFYGGGYYVEYNIFESLQTLNGVQRGMYQGSTCSDDNMYYLEAYGGDLINQAIYECTKFEGSQFSNIVSVPETMNTTNVYFKTGCEEEDFIVYLYLDSSCSSLVYQKSLGCYNSTSDNVVEMFKCTKVQEEIKENEDNLQTLLKTLGIIGGIIAVVFVLIVVILIVSIVVVLILTKKKGQDERIEKELSETL